MSTSIVRLLVSWTFALFLSVSLRHRLLLLHALLFSLPFSFRNGCTNISNDTCLLFFHCSHRYFGLRCSYPLYCLLMLFRGIGHFQQFLRTWSPLQEPCRASRDSNADAACFTMHTLHLHHPQALPEQSKYTLAPWRARLHAAVETLVSSLRVLQTVHTCVASHVLQIR